MNTIYCWFATVGFTLSPLPVVLPHSARVSVIWWWMATLLGIGIAAFAFFHEGTIVSSRNYWRSACPWKIGSSGSN